MTLDLFIHCVKIYYLIAIVFLVIGVILMFTIKDERMARFGFGMEFSQLITIVFGLTGVLSPLYVPFAFAFNEETKEEKIYKGE